MEKSVFGYPKSTKDEIGIYIVCDDSTLMNHINQMLRKQGMVVIADTAGRQHFLIDARKTPNRASHLLQQLLFRDNPQLIENDAGNCDGELERAINTILTIHGFDKTLIGTSLMAIFLKNLYLNGVSLKFKRAYAEVGKMFAMSCAQVERNIRYSLQKSDMWYDGLKNSKAYMILLDEIRDAAIDML